jgi:hypothetical protein
VIAKCKNQHGEKSRFKANCGFWIRIWGDTCGGVRKFAVEAFDFSSRGRPDGGSHIDYTYADEKKVGELRGDIGAVR